MTFPAELRVLQDVTSPSFPTWPEERDRARKQGKESGGSGEAKGELRTREGRKEARKVDEEAKEEGGSGKGQGGGKVRSWKRVNGKKRKKKAAGKE